MKRFITLCAVVFVYLGCTSSNEAAIIDDFNSGTQTFILGEASPSTQTGTASGTMVGGERDVQISISQQGGITPPAGTLRINTEPASPDQLRFGNRLHECRRA